MSEPDLLRTIVAATERITEVRRALEPGAVLESRAAARSPRGALFERELGRRDRVNIIAECKRRSPSRGVLAAAYDPVGIARRYEAASVAAISVLTEPTFFDGALDHLRAVRSAVETPLLRKDFIVDEYQVLEARAAGADAVLLIVAALAQADLVRLQNFAWQQGMAALVEVHDAEELARAVDSGARLIGVNNRNLRTLGVDVTASFELAAQIPADVIAVSESGLKAPEDLARLAAAGYRAFLIGERFMTDPDPTGAIRKLVATAGMADVQARRPGASSGPEREAGGQPAGTDGPFIKICGITRAEDARAAVEAGATAVGFVFWAGSPRYVEPSLAARIAAGVPSGIEKIGVFAGASPGVIQDVAAEVGLTAVQLHGDEPPSVAARIGRPVLRAFRVDEAEEASRPWPADVRVLLDHIDPERRGGTGTRVDWSRAAAVARGRRVVLAGGLTADNVADAIATVRPYGVDVSSGVELAPGVKDIDKIVRFVTTARAAFARIANEAAHSRGHAESRT